jgi:hypothetical protein
MIRSRYLQYSFFYFLKFLLLINVHVCIICFLNNTTYMYAQCSSPTPTKEPMQDCLASCNARQIVLMMMVTTSLFPGRKRSASNNIIITGTPVADAKSPHSAKLLANKPVIFAPAFSITLCASNLCAFPAL